MSNLGCPASCFYHLFSTPRNSVPSRLRELPVDELRAFGSDATPNSPRPLFSSSCLPRRLRSQVRRSALPQSRFLHSKIPRPLLPPSFRQAPLRQPAYPLQPSPLPAIPR